jgi:hypothetical protein
MARPRVFISSTFYDLKQLRADLERFVRELGYEAVMNERGSIPYGSTERLEDYCYREVELADIVIAIVGGRLGANSQQQPYSISQMELKRALDQGRQVYIFVERSVFSEYATYLRNKGKQIEYSFVDDPRVYEFLEELEKLPKNNATAPFETSLDITNYLREQWAGLFQRFLREQGRLREISLIDGLQNTAKTLDQLVEFLTEERRGHDSTITNILMVNHPLFQQLKSLTETPYHFVLADHDELVTWLSVRAYQPVPEIVWNEPDYEEFRKKNKDETICLKVYTGLFDETKKLRIYTSAEWNPDWVRLVRPVAVGDEITDDDVPF